MIEKILSLDKELFVFLNSLGDKSYDSLWLAVTSPLYWLPFFAIILLLLQKQLGGRKLLYFIGFTAVLILISDQSANLFKWYFHRIRPCNVEDLKASIHVVKSSSSFGFYSAHASNSMAAILFVYLVLRKKFTTTYGLFLFPLLFAYSRIYIGVHYPLDIFTGYAFGAIYGYLCYRLYSKYILK
jgi:undecaprenyl-diphosphatase